MVQFSTAQPVQTLAIPLLKCGIALLLVMLETERVGPVRLALLLDLFLGRRKRAVSFGRREELWVHLLILHTAEPIKLQEIRYQIINNFGGGGGSAHLGGWYLLGWYATEKLRV